MGRTRFARRERDARPQTLGRHRPAGPTSLALRFRRPWRLLAFGLALSLGASAVQAQTSVKLVGNTGQESHADGKFFAGEAYASGFTAGTHESGYTLTSVDIALQVLAPEGTTQPSFTVSIRSSSSDGNPAGSLGLLTNPASLTNGINVFTASGAGIGLATGMTYYMVLDVASEGDVQPNISFTYADGPDDIENADAAGWSIADATLVLGQSGTWTSAAGGLASKFAVHGYANQPQTPPPPRDEAEPPSGGGSPGGGGGGGAREPRNSAPEAPNAIGGLKLGTGGSAEVDLSAHFSDPDGDALGFVAESSDPAVAVEIDGGTLTVRGVAVGMAEIKVTATDPDGESATLTFTVTVTGIERVWHLPPAADPVLQGFVRVINHSDHAGHATVTATDDAGRTREPLTLALGRRGAAHFNVRDLEMGNPDKGLAGATGPGVGGWRLAIESETLAVEALAYARAADGFLTPLDGTAPKAADGTLELATFNPGSNWRQVSLLRLVNPTEDDAEAAVAGTDDAGSSPSAPVRLTVPAGTACTVDAAELESGSGLACGDPQAGLGDGTGKWRLRIESDAPLVALGLLRSPTGHLSNLSGGALPAGAGGVRHVLTFPSAADPDGRQGFVRIVSRSGRDGTVTVRAADGTAADYEVLTLALKAGQAVQFNSDDLEVGNADKGLTGSTGPGSGDWTLALSGNGVDFDAFAYVRSPDGFLAPMGASAPSRDADGASVSRVAFLNPGSNWRQRSILRLVNPGGMDADVSIEGTDDAGLRPGSPVRLTVPAGGSVELASAELESGDAAAIESGALGDGTGKWRLRIESDRPVAALSLATSPTGRLVNLSGADADRGFRHGLLPPPGNVALESPYECELLGRWDAAPGAPHAVDLLRDGERLAAHSAARWTHPTRRWAGLCGGTYTIRVCALNADGDCGPWSAESNAVSVD